MDSKDLDLTECDREPIHVPGVIQPHGTLVIARSSGEVLGQASNWADVLPGPTPPTHLSDFLGTATRERIAELLAQSPAPSTVPRLEDRIEGFDLIVHRNVQDLTLLELERRPPSRLSDAEVGGVLRDAVRRLEGVDEVQGLCERLARAVHELSGFGRVMIYRFLEDHSGVVVAEECAPGMESFLDLHYPASDIPTQARRLYEINLLRLIGDVQAEPARLLGPYRKILGGEVDLSHSVLRGISPIHVRYLKNMDVRASMSISLLERGKLWGLVACHHPQPLFVPFEVRQICELVGHVVATRIDLLEERQERRKAAEMRDVATSLVERLATEDDALDALMSAAPTLLEVIEADAVLVATNRRVVHAGEAPPDVDWPGLAKRIRGQLVGPSFATGSWTLDEAGKGMSWPHGVLALTIAGREPTLIAWLREEEVKTVTWAGDPNKPLVRDQSGVDRLQPRESFAAWSEERRGHARAWEPGEKLAAELFRERLLETSLRIAEELRDRSERLAALNEELRVANSDLDRFVQIASHDLQSPLRAIDNIARWLDEDATGLSADSKENLGLLRDRVTRMSRMLQDLVAYSRAGREKASVERITPSEVLEDLEAVLDIPPTFELDYPPDLPALRAPRAALELILRNLIANAIQHHDRPEGRIDVRATVQEERVRLEIRDDGPGIPPQHAERIFELFRVLRPRDESGGGGVGLAIARRMAEAHGGTLALGPAGPEGRGACFVLTWPRGAS